MRWWLHTDPPRLFSVDNASVSGMDYSMLDPLLYMVQWTDGAGEIEYQVDVHTNENGLREGFYDVTPWVPFFDQFLERIPRLTLDQAKKVKIDLARMLYDSKRQLPYHYVVAAGDYWWDASDATMFSAIIPTLTNIITTANATVDRVNSITNSSAGATGSIVSAVNAMVDDLNAQVNARIVTPNRTMKDDIGSYCINQGLWLGQHVDYLRGHINNTMIGPTWNGVGGGSTINMALHTRFFNTPDPGFNAAAPGLSGDIAQAAGPSPAYDWSQYLPADCYSTAIAVAHISLSSSSYLPLDHVAATNVQWIPVGSSTPVTVTPPEARAILEGITARTNSLNLIKNQHIANINALTTIADVIDYDVLTSWPVIPLPPGYRVEPPIRSPSSVSIVGTPDAPTEGVPEAPSNGVTYGRRNMAWNPALALSGDVLDGGNF